MSSKIVYLDLSLFGIADVSGNVNQPKATYTGLTGLSNSASGPLVLGISFSHDGLHFTSFISDSEGGAWEKHKACSILENSYRPVLASPLFPSIFTSSIILSIPSPLFFPSLKSLEALVLILKHSAKSNVNK